MRPVLREYLTFSWHLRREVLIRILKVAAASGLSYAAANAVAGGSRGYFAPLAAILIMQGTVAESVTRALERVFGVIAGVFAALFCAHFLGASPLGIGLLIFVSLVLGHQLRLGATGIPQVAVSALLILIVGTLEPGYWWQRICETVIGAVIGMVVNALVLPPSYLPEAQAAVDRFAALLASLLDGFGGYVASADRPAGARQLLKRARQINDHAKEVRLAVNHAMESLRWNIHQDQLTGAMRYWRNTADILERVSVTTRVIARQLADLERDPACGAALWQDAALRQGLARLFELSGRYMTLLTETGDVAAARAALLRDYDAALAAYAPLAQRMLELARLSDRDNLLAIHSILANLNVLVQDIRTHQTRGTPPARLS